MGYLSEMQLQFNSREISFAHKSFLVYSNVLKCCTEHNSNTTDSVPNFKMIRHLELMLWRNEISRVLSLRCVSEGYPILHNAPVSINTYIHYLFCGHYHSCCIMSLSRTLRWVRVKVFACEPNQTTSLMYRIAWCHAVWAYSNCLQTGTSEANFTKTAILWIND